MNKYTLLAATAILSMSAMSANATVTPTNVSTSVNAHVGIAKPNNIVKVQDVDFGYIFLKEDLDVTMDPATGEIHSTGYDPTDPDDPEDAHLYAYPNAKNGLLRATSPQGDICAGNFVLDIPSQVTLKNSYGDEITYDIETFTFKDETFIKNTSDAYAYKEVGIGGRITAPANIRPGDYNASFTATWVQDDGM